MNLATQDYEYSFEAFLPHLQSLAYEKAWKLATGQAETGLLLIGPVGVGKTHLALAVEHEKNRGIAIGWKPCLFISEVALLARVRESYKEHAAETEAQILNLCKAKPLLILDDLCKYTPQDSSFRNRVLFDILDFRCLRHKILLATANDSIESLEGKLGKPIADRLRDMCEVVEMSGKSFRGKR